MKTNICFWLYLAHFLLEWENFQTKVVEKIKTHILCLITLLRKSSDLWDNVEKHGRARQVTDDNVIECLRFAYWIPRATNMSYTQNMKYLLFYHGNNGLANAP